MKNFLMLSIVLTLFSSCAHYGHKSMDKAAACECKDGGCKSGGACSQDKKESQKQECDDCKKGTKS